MSAGLTILLAGLAELLLGAIWLPWFLRRVNGRAPTEGVPLRSRPLRALLGFAVALGIATTMLGVALLIAGR
jgi:hypothetical protein